MIEVMHDLARSAIDKRLFPIVYRPEAHSRARVWMQRARALLLHRNGRIARRPRAAASCVARLDMSVAVKLIVDGFVRLRDRRALETMREHRQRLRKSLQERVGGCFDVSRSIELCDDDIVIVEAGLARL